MRISQEGATNLASNLNNGFKGLADELNASVKSYSNAQNDVWRSENASLFAEELNSSITSVNTALGTLADSLTKSLRNVVDMFNSMEGTAVTFPGLSYPGSAERVVAEKSWAGGSVGVVEGSQVKNLQPSFEAILTGLKGNLNSMKSSIDTNTMFEGKTFDAVREGFEAVNSTINTKLDDLRESFNTRTQNEDTARETNEQNIINQLNNL